MTLDHCVLLSLKSFSCLPNDVVSQKIIKNHLGCNLPFSPSAPLPTPTLTLVAWNSAIYVSSCTLIALGNSGTSSQMGTLPKPAVHPPLPRLSRRQCMNAQ